MRNLILLFLCLVALLFLFGCDNSDFSPRGELEDNIAVYFILDNSQKTQFLKYQKLYFPENGVDTASPEREETFFFIGQSVIAPNGRKRLMDTTVSGISNYKVCCLSGFTPIRGEKYDLTVIRPGKEDLTSSIYMPPQTNIRVTNNAEAGIKAYITSTSRDPVLSFYFRSVANIGYPARASYFRMFLLYEVLKDGKIIEGKLEVPVGMNSEGGYVYPSLRDSGEVKSYVSVKNTTMYLNDNSRINGTEETITINQTLFMDAMKSIGTKYQTSQVKVKRGFVLYLTYDSNMANYLASLSQGGDSYSVRLDDLNWSNIVTGNRENLGLFGAITRDTAYFDIYSGVSDFCGFKSDW